VNEGAEVTGTLVIRLVLMLAALQCNSYG